MKHTTLFPLTGVSSLEVHPTLLNDPCRHLELKGHLEARRVASTTLATRAALVSLMH